MTGGSIAVFALGSTGCSIKCSSSSDADKLEFDRSLVVLVFCVSALCKGFANREEMLPLCRTDIWIPRISNIPRDVLNNTYSLWTVQHSYAEIP